MTGQHTTTRLSVLLMALFVSVAGYAATKINPFTGKPDLTGAGGGGVSLSSTNTWTGGNTFQSSTTFNGNVNFSSGVLLSGAAGTSGQVFTSNGSGTVPTWQTVAGTGDAILAATQTWSGGNTFNSWSDFNGSITAVTANLTTTTASYFAFPLSGTGQDYIVQNAAGSLSVFIDGEESLRLVEDGANGRQMQIPQNPAFASTRPQISGFTDGSNRQRTGISFTTSDVDFINLGTVLFEFLGTEGALRFNEDGTAAAPTVRRGAGGEQSGIYWPDSTGTSAPKVGVGVFGVASVLVTSHTTTIINALNIPNGSAPTVDAMGEVAVDTNAISGTMGSLTGHDGTQQFYAAVTTNTPSTSINQGILMSTTTGKSRWDDEPLRRTLSFVIDGGGSVFTTGAKNGYAMAPCDMLLTDWYVVSYGTGSVVVDIWKSTFDTFPPAVSGTITGSNKPTLSSAQKSSGTTSGWINTVSKGEWLRVNVDSVSTSTGVVVTLNGVVN